jgi:DNA-binding IclR family transcriptional regulator
MQGAGGVTTRALVAIEDKALTFIVGYIESKGYPPSISEIGDAIGRSRSVTHRIVHQLQQKGWLELDGGPRMMRVVGL